jgi:DNA-binding beta-propeller fold protein YncE
MARTTLRLSLLLGLLAVGCEREVEFPADLTWGDPPVPGYTGQARVALSNNGDDTLAFVSVDSLDQPQLLGLAKVGKNPIELEGPHHLIGSPDGRFLYYNLSNYVVGGGSGPHGAHGTGTVPGYLIKLDARTLRSVGEALIDRSPGDVIISPDGKRAFVSHYDLARLSSQLTRNAPPEQGYSSIVIVDTERMDVLTQVPVCPTAHGQGLSADGKHLYVTCSLSDQLAVLDVSDPARTRILAKVAVGPAPGPTGEPRYAPYALSVHPDGSVWISNNQSQDIRVFNPATMQMDPERIVPVGGIAMFGEFSPDGATLYVPTQGVEQVVAIDTTTRPPQKKALPLPREACLAAHALVQVPGNAAALVCEGDHRARKGTLVFIDLAAWAVRGHVEVGLYPDGAAVLPGLPR